MKSTSQMVLRAVTSTCFALLCTLPINCLAQTSSKQPPKRVLLKNTQNPEFKSERLTKPVDMPFLPPYSGKNVEFVTGTVFPAVKGGPSVTMEFSVREKPQEVLDWYKAAFKEHKWKSLDDMTGANGLAAMNSHNICQIMTLGPSKKGAKCDFLLRYKFYKPTTF